MSRFRMYPTPAQQAALLAQCGYARYVWNLALEQWSMWTRDKAATPGFAAQCRQLTEARAVFRWLRAGSQTVQQQALRDFSQAVAGRVEKVNPAYTSQTCSVCGHRAPDNRENQAVFRCTACGHQANADVNAAINIAAGRAVSARRETPKRVSPKREPQLATSA